MVKRALLVVVFTLSGVSLIQAQSPAAGGKNTIPAGTMLHCRITQTLTTKLNFQGDAFTARVSEPVIMDGHEAIPVGATITGRVARMERPGRLKGVGQMRLNAETLAFPDGRTFPMSAVLMTAYGAENAKVVGSEGTIQGPSSRLQNTEEIGGGAAAGSLVGLLFGHPWIGVAVGGTAGFVDRLRRGGKDLSIPAGTQLNYQLTRPLELFQESRHATDFHSASGTGN